MRPILSRTQHNKKLKRREATKMFKPGVNSFLMRSIHSVRQIQLTVCSLPLLIASPKIYFQPSNVFNTFVLCFFSNFPARHNTIYSKFLSFFGKLAPFHFYDLANLISFSSALCMAVTFYVDQFFPDFQK